MSPGFSVLFSFSYLPNPIPFESFSFLPALFLLFLFHHLSHNIQVPREKARQICAGGEENEWVRRIVLEMISLLDSDDAERRRIALEVEKEMEAAEQKMNAA